MFPIVLFCEVDVTVVVVADGFPGVVVVTAAAPTFEVGVVVVETADRIALESILNNNARFSIYRQKKGLQKVKR